MQKSTQTLVKIIVTCLIALIPHRILAQETSEQFINVTDLRDVSPTDWSFQALKNMVEKYGCLTGYPDQTFRGDRTLTRYEFASALNTCLERFKNTLTSEDLTTFQRLASDFRTEIDNLAQKVDTLNQKVASLENQQFSTNTKLKGEAIFGLTDVNEGEITLSDRIRLNLITTFNGKDLLKTRIQANNVPNLAEVTKTDMSRLSFDGSNNNNATLNEVYYRSPLGDKATIYIGALGLDIEDVEDVLEQRNPHLSSSGKGALSRFNRLPLLSLGNEGTGVGLKYQVAKNTDLTAYYLTKSNPASNSTQGIFNSNLSTGIQINYNPNDTLKLGLTYKHDYFAQGTVNLTSSTGSIIGKDPWNKQTAATQDSIGFNADWDINKNLQVGGWAGYALANAQNIDSNAELFTWQLHTSLKNFGKQGAVLSFAGGQPPKATSVKDFPSDRDTSYILETQYKYPLTNNITITPGFYVVLNPDHNNDNAPIYVSALRTTLNF